MDGVKRGLTRASVRRLSRRVGVAALAYLLVPIGLLGALEGVARRVWPLPPRTVPEALVMVQADGFYVNRPGFRGGAFGQPVTISSRGLRRNVAETDDARPRVLLLGDSVAFGLGVSDEEAPDAVLESLLGDSVRVLNAGTIGYATSHAARYLTAHGDAFAPDAVLLLYCLNDPLPTAHPADALQREASLPRLRRFVARLERQSSLARQTVATGRRLAVSMGRTVSPGDALVALHDGPAWTSVARGVEQIQAWCDERGLPFALAVVPVASQVRGETLLRPQERLAALGRDLGVPVLDLRDALTDADFLAGDETHLSARGVRRAMAAAAPFVRTHLFAARLPVMAPPLPTARPSGALL